MSSSNLKPITILYTENHSLEFKFEFLTGIEARTGRVIIDEKVRNGKSIIAVFDGHVTVLNKAGERALSRKPYLEGRLNA